VTRAATLLLLLLAAGCASKPKDPYDTSKGPKLVLQVELEGDGIARMGDDIVVPISDGWQTNKQVPEGIRETLMAGRRWIVLKEPLVFAAAARPLANGDTPFVPERIEIRAAHDTRPSAEGSDIPLRPALLIMSGWINHEDVKRRSGITIVKDLTLSDLGNSEGLTSIDSDVDRVALGVGIETALRIVTGRYQKGLAGQSSFDWVATFKDGKPVASDQEWIDAIDQPAKTRDVYHAIIRRYRPSQDPKVTFFSVPLNVVLLCSQMNVTKPEGQPVKWHWEGWWFGRAVSVENPPKPRGPRVAIIYKEFRTKPIHRTGGEFLSSVFNPITRTGRAAVDEIKRRDAEYVPPEK